jgi:hypothetical protein
MSRLNLDYPKIAADLPAGRSSTPMSLVDTLVVTSRLVSVLRIKRNLWLMLLLPSPDLAKEFILILKHINCVHLYIQE